MHQIWRKFETFDIYLAPGSTDTMHLTGPDFVSPYLSAVYSSISDGINRRWHIIHGTTYKFQQVRMVPHREWQLDFGRAIGKVRTTLKKQGREEVFVGAKMIYTTLRILFPEEIE